MTWTLSKTLALAKQSCTKCFGLGLCVSHSGKSRPCHCVERAVFRACYRRFCECVHEDKPIGRVSLEANRGREYHGKWCMKNEEYAADFVLVAKRVLGEGTLAHKIFKFHYLYGADCSLCARRLKLDRGEFFHEVYRIQQRLGRAFSELEPYALFPLDEYFGGSVKHERPAAALPLERSAVRAPLRAVAA